MENSENKFGSHSQKPWEERGDQHARRFDSHNRSFGRSDRPSGFRNGGDLENRRYSKPYRKFDDNADFRPQNRWDNDKPRQFSRDGEQRSFRKFNDGERSEYKPRRNFNNYDRKPRFNDENGEQRSFRKFDGEQRPFRKFGEGGDRRDFKPRRFGDSKPFRKPFTRNYERPTQFTSIDKSLLTRNFSKDEDDWTVIENFERPELEEVVVKKPATEAEGYRLNRFISNAGVCSRRAADDFIADGRITVNGTVVTDFSTKIFPKDEVCLDGKKLESQRKVYILFNKPKDCISTKSDPEGRKTVFDYVQTDVEVENVGRLDRNTTGVMLFTNDGSLIERLTHPRYNKMKIYHVFLNKNLSNEDFEKIRAGVELEDGFVEIDDLQYVEGEKSQIGIQIHSGKNRVVRRIFENAGYEVEKLDRVYFAGLTKKNLPRGQWRYLTQAEVAILKRGAYA